MNIEIITGHDHDVRFFWNMFPFYYLFSPALQVFLNTILWIPKLIINPFVLFWNLITMPFSMPILMITVMEITLMLLRIIKTISAKNKIQV